MALRGAITVESNDAHAIVTATTELLTEVMERNALGADEMVSCIFTCTPDLNAEFPAVAARQLGLSQVPLLCAQEIDVYNAMPQVIRILLHCHLPEDRDVRHVYLREAVDLRKDLQGAQ